MVKCTGRGLVVKRPGVLSKVQMLKFVLGVGVFSLLSSVFSTSGQATTTTHGGHRNIDIRKQGCKPGSSKPSGKKFPKLAWILAPKAAWIWRGFLGREKRAETIEAISGKNSRQKFAPVSAKIRDRTRAAKSEIHGELPPNSSFCAC